MEYSAQSTFDHALNSPFDNPPSLPGSQLPGLSVWCMTAVTSVSTVYNSIRLPISFVKHFLEFYFLQIIRMTMGVFC